MSTLPFSLVATDLDGTLVTHDKGITPRTQDALTRATEAGAAHVIVTGRSVSWTVGVFEELGYEGLAVCSQGAQVYNAGTRELLTSITLDRKVAQLAVDKLTAELGDLRCAVSRTGVDGQVVVEPDYLYEEPMPVVKAFSRSELFDEPLLKLYVQHSAYTDDQLTALVRVICAGIVDVTHSGAGIIELLPIGLSKATGLSLAARRLGKTKADTIAFGDMPNDVPMLKWAAHGVAMANAHDELKAVADEVTLSNAEDGVAVVLERLYQD